MSNRQRIKMSCVVSSKYPQQAQRGREYLKEQEIMKKRERIAELLFFHEMEGKYLSQRIDDSINERKQKHAMLNDKLSKLNHGRRK